MIIAIEENTSDLNKLTQEMYYIFQNDSKRATIENSFLRTSNKSFIYKTILSNKVFKNMKIRYVYINYDTKNIKFSVKCKFGTYCGFYYSFDNNKNYEIITESIKQDKLTSYFELGNETALLWQMKSGWYTEKIYNNWYYYEDDWDYLNFIKYTYDENGNIKTVIDKDGLKTTYTYDENDNEVIRTTAENKLTDAKVERLSMKGLSEPNVTTYRYAYWLDKNKP